MGEDNGNVLRLHCLAFDAWLQATPSVLHPLNVQGIYGLGSTPTAVLFHPPRFFCGCLDKKGEVTAAGLA